MEAFYSIMANTEIYAWDCEEFRQVFSAFDEKVCVTFLTDEDYINLVKGLIRGREGFTEREKTRLVFDLEQGNRRELFEGLGITSVYDLEKFMVEFTLCWSL